MNSKVTNENGPIRAEKRYKRKQRVKESVQTIHTFTQSSAICTHLHKTLISAKMSNDQDLSKSKISQVYMRANYEYDRTIQKRSA